MNYMRIAFAAGALMAALSATAEPVAVVSSKSAIASASKDDVGNLFLGKNKSVGGASATPIAFKDGNATKEAFYKKFADKTPDQAKQVLSKQIFTGKATPLKEVSSDAEMKAALASDASAVGMIDSGAVDGSLKVIGK